LASVDVLNKRKAILIWAQSVDEIGKLDEKTQESNKMDTTLGSHLINESGEDVSISTTILTVPTTATGEVHDPDPDASLISLMTATNVVVRSARFSPKQKLILPDPIVTKQYSEFTHDDTIKKHADVDAEGSIPHHDIESPEIVDIKSHETSPDHHSTSTSQMTLSPPMSPDPYSGGGGRIRRRSSIFKELLAGKKELLKNEQIDEEEILSEENERKESLAISITSQTSSSGKGKSAQLQHTNSVTTISYLKSFFRRASKATGLGAATAAETPAPKIEKPIEVIEESAAHEHEVNPTYEGSNFSPRGWKIMCICSFRIALAYLTMPVFSFVMSEIIIKTFNQSKIYKFLKTINRVIRIIHDNWGHL
jgi:hypothetical protein